MTDLTMLPQMINAFLIIFIVNDVVSEGWSWSSIIGLILLITWNLLLFELVHGPQKPPLTNEEFRQKYPEIWDKMYLQPYWCGFWEFNDLQASLLKEQS